MPDDPIYNTLNKHIKGSKPDAFMLQCRSALVSLVAKMPTDQAKYIYDFVSTQCPYSTEQEHQDWIDSPHYKAIQLEVQFKLSNQA